MNPYKIMTVHVDKVADRILAIAKDNESEVSNLKLQKLLYYSQGFHLALHGQPLFDEDVEAWAHGPVVPSIYHKYKQYGSSPIDAPARTSKLDAEKESLLQEVYNVFGQFSGWKLRDMTHNEAPWIENEGTAGTISKSTLKRYFKTRVA